MMMMIKDPMFPSLKIKETRKKEIETETTLISLIQPKMICKRKLVLID